jgi:hypothetical protein
MPEISSSDESADFRAFFSRISPTSQAAEFYQAGIQNLVPRYDK